MESILCIQASAQKPATTALRLAGKRAAMATFSAYPGDPRPRRAVEALLAEGMSVDLICLADGKGPAKEASGVLTVFRVPLTHTRGGKLRYVLNYLAFLVSCGLLMSLRLFRGRFDLVYAHNMPDVLVFSGLVPKLFGAKIILDQHDPMPELMTTIYGLDPESVGVRLIRSLEKLSLGFADRVITVNVACKRIFGRRSCAPSKITVVMNSPDERIFGTRLATSHETGGNHVSRKFVVMYHGSLVERNGLDLAIEALALLHSEVPEIELRVYGRETPYLWQVMDRANALAIADRIRYLGSRRIEELPGEILTCDVGVIPNQRNAFTEINTPTRIFEYLSLGKPVIAPSTQGILDYFDSGSLVFFESGDREDLAAKLRFVHNKRSQVQAITARGQQVLQQHTWVRERETLIETVATLLRPKATA